MANEMRAEQTNPFREGHQRARLNVARQSVQPSSFSLISRNSCCGGKKNETCREEKLFGMNGAFPFLRVPNEPISFPNRSKRLLFPSKKKKQHPLSCLPPSKSLKLGKQLLELGNLRAIVLGLLLVSLHLFLGSLTRARAWRKQVRNTLVQPSPRSELAEFQTLSTYPGVSISFTSRLSRRPRSPMKRSRTPSRERPSASFSM